MQIKASNNKINLRKLSHSLYDTVDVKVLSPAVFMEFFKHPLGDDTCGIGFTYDGACRPDLVKGIVHTNMTQAGFHGIPNEFDLTSFSMESIPESPKDEKNVRAMLSDSSFQFYLMNAQWFVFPVTYMTPSIRSFDLYDERSVAASDLPIKLKEVLRAALKIRLEGGKVGEDLRRIIDKFSGKDINQEVKVADEPIQIPPKEPFFVQIGVSRSHTFNEPVRIRVYMKGSLYCAL